MHGFLWLKNTPNIKKLQWNNFQSVHNAINYIDKYVFAWNHYLPLPQNPTFPRHVDNPYLLNTTFIMSSNPFNDYNELANCVQCHKKCTLQIYLRKKGSTFECRYKAPWPLQDTSTLALDDKGQPN